MNLTKSGRPRDPRIDDEVLATTRDMLIEVGWEQLSLRAISARTGVSRASMARRWPSKAHLVLHAILGATPDLSPFEGTDRMGWIRWVVTGSSELFARSEVRAAGPGLLAAIRDHADLRTALWQGFSGPSTALF
ncbi:MAG: helix-turn-helix transcriptional regulator, partial [Rhodococcus sp.]|nr:helix-turn-helix transcriptional regulator [Rhodococcus sp. (in: high G+C Gram-positive bacteria)]